MAIVPIHPDDPARRLLAGTLAVLLSAAVVIMLLLLEQHVREHRAGGPVVGTQQLDPHPRGGARPVSL